MGPQQGPESLLHYSITPVRTCLLCDHVVNGAHFFHHLLVLVERE